MTGGSIPGSIGSESSQFSDLGIGSLQTTEEDDDQLYEGVDDILQVEIHQEDYMTLGGGSTREGDLYDVAVMGNYSGSQSEGQGSQGNIHPISSTSSVPGGEKRIPLAYTHNLVDETVALSTIVSCSNSSNKPETCRDSSTLRSRNRNAVYMGNLTWWTKDEDVREACKTVGIEDVIDIRIHESKVNGQSRGFCSITFSSEGSITEAFDKLGEITIHGNTPLIKTDTKQSLYLLDSMAKTRPLPSSSACHPSQMGMNSSGGPRGMGFGVMNQNGGGGNYGGGMPHNHNNRLIGSSVTGGGSGIRYPRSNNINNGNRPLRTNGGFNLGVPIPPFHNGYSHMGPRGPPRPPTMIGNNGYYDEWCQPPPWMQPPHPHMNPAFLGPFLPPGGLNQSSPPQLINPFAEPPPTPAISTGTISSSTFQKQERLSSSLTEVEFEDLLNRNSSVSTAAIKRAVADAANGEYASAIETIVTAISLIRSSKIAKEKRCVVLINSLHDALEGIENRSYGNGRKFRSLSNEKERKSSSYRHHRSSRSPPSHRSRSRDGIGRMEERDSYRSQREHHVRTSEGTTRSRRRSSWEEQGQSPFRISRDPRTYESNSHR